MTELTMINSAEIDTWMWERKEHYLFSVKGPPPSGATYSDGDPIINPINIAWVDSETGERIDCVYAK
jgi:hypothetical protein